MQHGIAHLGSGHGLASRALRDPQRGLALGRFRVGNPYLALAGAAGALLGLLQLSLSRSDLVGPDAAAEIAEQLLRMLGIGPDEASAIARLPLPNVEQH